MCGDRPGLAGRPDGGGQSGWVAEGRQTGNAYECMGSTQSGAQRRGWVSGSPIHSWCGSLSEDISPTSKDIKAAGLVGGRRAMDGQGV